MAETSPRGIDRRRRGPAGGWWRGTSQWRTFCSTCSPKKSGVGSPFLPVPERGEIRCRFTILARARKGGKSGPDYAPKDELTPDYAHVPPREVGGTRVNPNPRMKRPCISLAVA